MHKKAISLYITVTIMFAVVYVFSALPGNMLRVFGYHGVDGGFELFSSEAWLTFFDKEVDNRSAISWSSVEEAVAEDISYDTKVSSLVEKVAFDEVSRSPSATEKSRYEYLIGTLFASFPEAFIAPLDQLTFSVKNTGSRGLAGSHSMILRTEGVSDSELVAVATHELGHIVDLGMLKGTNGIPSGFKDGHKEVYTDDPSLAFYRISWVNDTTRKGGSSSSDFVSGYAMSDPFEDLAESFLYYVAHGKEFKRLAIGNDALQAKYSMIKYDLFDGKEFLENDQSYLTTTLAKRPWDATKEPFLMDQLMHARD